MAEKASRRTILKNAAAAAGALGGSAVLAGTAEARTPHAQKKAWGPPPKNGESAAVQQRHLLRQYALPGRGGRAFSGNHRRAHQACS